MGPLDDPMADDFFIPNPPLPRYLHNNIIFHSHILFAYSVSIM